MKRSQQLYIDKYSGMLDLLGKLFEYQTGIVEGIDIKEEFDEIVPIEPILVNIFKSLNKNIRPHLEKITKEAEAQEARFRISGSFKDVFKASKKKKSLKVLKHMDDSLTFFMKEISNPYRKRTQYWVSANKWDSSGLKASYPHYMHLKGEMRRRAHELLNLEMENVTEDVFKSTVFLEPILYELGRALQTNMKPHLEKIMKEALDMEPRNDAWMKILKIGKSCEEINSEYLDLIEGIK